MREIVVRELITKRLKNKEWNSERNNIHNI